MHHEPLKIVQNDKFYSFLLSREKMGPNPSFRVYYADDIVAVPFLWESQPGTPKHSMSAASSLPPLTPPPSFSLSSKTKANSGKTRSLKLRKPTPQSSSSQSSSSSSSSYPDFEDRHTRYSLGAIKNAFLEIFTCAKLI